MPRSLKCSLHIEVNYTRLYVKTTRLYHESPFHLHGNLKSHILLRSSLSSINALLLILFKCFNEIQGEIMQPCTLKLGPLVKLRMFKTYLLYNNLLKINRAKETYL